MRTITSRRFVAAGAAAAFLLAGCGGDSGSVEAFCDKLEEFDSTDPTEGTEFGTEEFFAAMEDAFDELSSSAPDEIQDDLASLEDAFNELANQADTIEDDPEALAAMMEQMTDVEAATERLDAYAEENCEGA